MGANDVLIDTPPKEANLLYTNAERLTITFFRKALAIDGSDLGSLEANLEKIILSPIPFKILKLPKFLAIINYANYDRTKLSIDYSDKDFNVSGEADYIFEGKSITKEDLAAWGNGYASYAQSSKLFITEKCEPFIIGKATDFEFISDDFADSLDDVKAESLIGQIDLGNYCVFSNGKLYAVSDYNFPKLFYRRFLLWFNSLSDGAVGENQNPDTMKASLTGTKIYFGKYLQSLGYDKPFKSIIPQTLLPYIDVTKIEKTNFCRIPPSKLLTEFKAKLPKDKKNLLASNDNNNPYKGILTEVDLPEISKHVKVSWGCFTNNFEAFKFGCQIVLAPGEVILGKHNKIILRSSDVREIIYRGKDFPDSERRNIIEILSAIQISTFVLQDAREFFKEEFKAGFVYKLVPNVVI